MNYSDTIEPIAPSGFEGKTPLLIIQREEGEYTSGYLTQLYDDGSYFEYTNKVSFINDKYEVEEKDVSPGWYPIVHVSPEGISQLRTYIIEKFDSLIIRREEMSSDIGMTTYTAFINDQYYYWQKTIIYMNEEEVPMQIEYIINTNIDD